LCVAGAVAYAPVYANLLIWSFSPFSHASSPVLIRLRACSAQQHLDTVKLPIGSYFSYCRS
jgi:hypothetical protein